SRRPEFFRVNPKVHARNRRSFKAMAEHGQIVPGHDNDAEKIGPAWMIGAERIVAPFPGQMAVLVEDHVADIGREPGNKINFGFREYDNVTGGKKRLREGN